MNEMPLIELLTRISWTTPIKVQEEDGTILHHGDVEVIVDPTNPFDTERPVESLHTENNCLVITLTSDDE